MTQDQDDYEIGYGKPPKEHQFKKGQSGNPAGGPKKLKSEKAILLEMLGKKHVVSTADGPVKLTAMELLARRHLKDSLDGKVGSAKILWSRIDAYGIGREDETEELSEADNRILDEFMRFARSEGEGSDDV